MTPRSLVAAGVASLLAGVLLTGCSGSDDGQTTAEPEPALVNQVQQRQAWGDAWPFKADAALINCELVQGTRILTADVAGEALALDTDTASYFGLPLADTVMVGDETKRERAIERLRRLAARTCDPANIAPGNDTPPD